MNVFSAVDKCPSFDFEPMRIFKKRHVDGLKVADGGGKKAKRRRLGEVWLIPTLRTASRYLRTRKLGAMPSPICEIYKRKPDEGAH
jgi:hypothetical protein